MNFYKLSKRTVDILAIVNMVFVLGVIFWSEITNSDIPKVSYYSILVIGGLIFLYVIRWMKFNKNDSA